MKRLVIAAVVGWALLACGCCLFRREPLLCPPVPQCQYPAPVCCQPAPQVSVPCCVPATAQAVQMAPVTPRPTLAR